MPGPNAVRSIRTPLVGGNGAVDAIYHGEATIDLSYTGGFLFDLENDKMTEQRIYAHLVRSSGAGLENYLPGRKIAQGSGDAWRDLDAQIFSRPAQEKEILVPAVAEPLVVYILSGEAFVEERDPDGDWIGARVREGAFYLTHADEPYHMRWRTSDDRPFEVLQLYPGHALMEAAAESLGLKFSATRLRDISAGDDPLVAVILAALADELRRGPDGNAYFVQSLARGLCVHLLRNFSEHSAVRGRSQARLPAWLLRRVLAHMDAHLADKFDLDVLAELCAMSRFHFSRAFRNTTGQSPSRWFMARKVEKAKSLLRETTMPVIEISMAVGYDSPGHFSQVFRKNTGLSPTAYRAM
ncbi:AraC family transcriptional regulator [Martelella mangrovi]|uniref:AraC family transcriptional regulator n=1 Tax=Martelella mangrovi TaxID=1397477 RepID=A0ABV2IGJ8_9HYPH